MLSRILVGTLLVAAACGRFRFADLPDGGPDVPIDTPDCGHTFCDNFDRLGPVEAGWDEVVYAGGTMSLDSALAVSAPASLLVDLGPPPGGLIYVKKHLPMATTSIHFEVELDLEVTNVNAEVDLVHINWNPPPAGSGCTSFGQYLVRDKTNQFEVQETYGNCLGGNRNDLFTQQLPSGFHHLDFDITFGTPGHVTLLLDGATSLVDSPTVADLPSGSIDVEIGCGGVQQLTGPWTMRFDNVIVDLH